jgi:predicted Zn-dependent peptidase
MAIIMVGDFNSDELIKKIDKAFAYMQPKPVQEYKPAPEAPITAPIVKKCLVQRLTILRLRGDGQAL